MNGEQNSTLRSTPRVRIKNKFQGVQFMREDKAIEGQEITIVKVYCN